MTSEGKKGVDYEEHKLEDVSNIKDGRKIYKSQRTSIFIEGETIPLMKIGDNINEYVKVSKEHENNLVFKDDILISLSGSCGKITRSMYEKAYRTNNLAKFHDIKINKNYFYYSLRYLFENIDTKGSVIPQIQIDSVRKTIIKVPSSSTMKKYNLEKLFNEVDQIKERLETTKKEHEKEVNLLMKPFENKTQVKVQTKSEKLSDSDDEDLDDYSDDESSEEEKVPLKKTTKGIPQKQSKN